LPCRKPPSHSFTTTIPPNKILLQQRHLPISKPKRYGKSLKNFTAFWFGLLFFENKRENRRKEKRTFE
jgi:hypothetical protein